MSFRASVIRSVSGMLYHSGLVGPIARGVAFTHPRPRVPILAFHRVNDDDDPFMPSLPTAVFAAHMAHIARHYRVLTVEELAGGVSGTVLAVRGPGIALVVKQALPKLKVTFYE